jgi:tripartite ATP-independent transporter DctP family solute receptor
MNKLILVCVSLLISFALTACGKSNQAANKGDTGTSQKKAETVTIRVGNIYNETTTYGVALNKLKEEINKASNGEIKLDIFHGGQLGSEKDHIEALKSGSLEMMESGTAGISLYVPETAIFELWYNFNDVNDLAKVFESLTPDLDKMYQQKGFKLLGAYYDGPRNILSKKKIQSLDEIKGLKFRVPGSKLYVDMANALGAKATSMGLGEVYTGLQTGVIDAVEGTPDSVFQQKFYEQAKYYIDDRHVYQPLSIVFNKAAWDKLSDAHKKIMENAVKENSKYFSTLALKANEDAFQKLKEKGVEIVPLKDSAKWKDAVSKDKIEFVKQYGETGDMILKKIEQTLQK